MMRQIKIINVGNKKQEDLEREVNSFISDKDLLHIHHAPHFWVLLYETKERE